MIPVDDRFQNQPWYIKLWRFRHYLGIPFDAIHIFYHEQIREMRDPDDWRMRFSDCWSMAIGSAQLPMKWYYHSDELNDDFSLKHDVEIKQ